MRLDLYHLAVFNSKYFLVLVVQFQGSEDWSDNFVVDFSSDKQRVTVASDAFFLFVSSEEGLAGVEKRERCRHRQVK